MKAYLERIDASANMARFYSVAVVPTLFGEWAVVREWGRIGQAGTIREETFAAETRAAQAAEAQIIRKGQDGYNLRGAKHAVLQEGPIEPHSKAALTREYGISRKSLTISIQSEAAGDGNSAC
jgi:predicted DNA-binding WGR domain protein